MMLHDIGFKEIEINPVYDKLTENAVKILQNKHQIPVDGVVGSLTKIVLYNEISELEIPHLLDESNTPSHDLAIKDS